MEQQDFPCTVSGTVKYKHFKKKPQFLMKLNIQLPCYTHSFHFEALTREIKAFIQQKDLYRSVQSN